MSERLAAELRRQGGLLAEAVRSDVAPAADSDDGFGRMAAAGPRAEGNRAEYELLVELIREGYLLHYGRARVVDTEDPDLALLAGDQLYALGLARLALLGDLEAVGELADVISLCAQAHADERPDLAEAVWLAGAVAVGWGPTAAHAAAKEAARERRDRAGEGLRVAARQARGDEASLR